MSIVVKPSTNTNKKYMTVINFPNIKKTIHFGAKGMSDFTKHKDENRKKRYDARHRPNENWNDPLSAGFWAKWVPSLTLASVASGCDGLIIEMHPNPKKSAVDPLQPLNFKEFNSLRLKLKKIAKSINRNIF